MARFSPIKTKNYYRNASVVVNELKTIVTPANIRRLVFFDAINGETTLKDKSANAQNATLSLAASALDVGTQGKARTLTFNADGDTWVLADSNDLSFGDGAGNDSPFSLIWCGKPVLDSNFRMAIQKDNRQAGATEYHFGVDSANSYRFVLYKSDATATIGRKYATAITTDANTFITLVGTYSGSKADTGIKIYRNSTRIDDTPITIGTYGGMSNTASNVANYHVSAAGATEWVQRGTNAVVAIAAEELSQAQVTAIDSLLRKYVGVI